MAASGAAARARLIVRAAAFAVAVFGTVSRIVTSSAEPAAPGQSVWGYFTIQSNLMVCLFLAWGLVRRIRAWKAIRGEHIVHGAVLLYISITGLVYNTLLAATVEASGLSALLLHVNHTVTPILFAADWAVNRERMGYRWRAIAIWLLYPIAYGIGASVEGAATGVFRYFFLDFAGQSTDQYLMQLAMVTVVFVLVSVVIVGLSRLRAEPAEAEPGVAEPTEAEPMVRETAADGRGRHYRS